MMDKKIKGRLIYLISDTQGLLHKNLAFYVVDLNNGKRELIGKLSTSTKNIVLSHFRLTERLLRLEPKCAGRLDDSRYVVCALGKLWLLDVQKQSISELRTTRPGFGVLNFCNRDGDVFWGDYGANSNYEEINIYRLDNDLNHSIVYTFPKNSIRHIHNIIKAENGFFVFTGDNEPNAGIYKATLDWSEVKLWKNGEQKYRAVVGFPYKKGLLYATDSVETENHLRFIMENGSEQVLDSINGSCIYGGENKNYYFFSTTVESHEGGGLLNMLSNKLGGGIKSKDVHVIAVNKKDFSVKIIKKYRKDIWPMKLFQYGTMFFPNGQETIEKEVWGYNLACKKNDGKTLRLESDE